MLVRLIITYAYFLCHSCQGLVGILIPWPCPFPVELSTWIYNSQPRKYVKPICFLHEVNSLQSCSDAALDWLEALQSSSTANYV